MRNISYDITFVVQFLYCRTKMFSHYLSGNIGQELELEPKLREKWSRSWSRNLIILAPQH